MKEPAISLLIGPERESRGNADPIRLERGQVLDGDIGY